MLTFTGTLTILKGQTYN